MSGIAGIWTPEPHDLADIAVFTNLMEHRGDDQGFLRANNGRFSLGSRLLAIVGTPGNSTQPMLTEDGRYAIVFNGEIFNHREIRHLLEGKGHRFKTETDTEVFLSAYVEFGTAFQESLNGQWAAAIWDTTERTLFLSRDQVGRRPLYYLSTDDGFAFASERKAFAALPWAHWGPDISNSKTVALKPGTCAIVSGPGTQVKISRWWNQVRRIKESKADYQDQVIEFRELFLEACRSRLHGNVRHGITVSGGLDSSFVAGAMGVIKQEDGWDFDRLWGGAYTATARGTEHDELEYADAAIRSSGFEPIVIDVMEVASPDDMDKYLYAGDGAHLSNLMAWYIYREMRSRDVHITLDGLGADTYLIGEFVDLYRYIQAYGSWIRRPRRTLELVKIAAELSVGSPYTRLNSRTQVLLKLLMLSTPAIREPLAGVSSRVKTFLAPWTHDWDPELVELARDLPALQKQVFLELYDILPEFLERFDLLSMSNQVEIRMPFVDTSMVDLALSLPGESIVGDGYTKRIIRDAMRPYLPAKVVDRKKKLRLQGPVPTLLRKNLRPWVLEMAYNPDDVNRILDANQYIPVMSVGRNVVDRWRTEVFPKQVQSNVSRLKAEFERDSSTVRDRLVELD